MLKFCTIVAAKQNPHRCLLNYVCFNMWNNLNNMSKKWLFNDINSDFQACQIAYVWPNFFKKTNKNPLAHQTEVRDVSEEFLRHCGMNAWFQWVIASAEKGQKVWTWVGSSEERRSTHHCRGWSYTFLMPFAELWHASPVGQKENCAFQLPPAALNQWKRAA